MFELRSSKIIIMMIANKIEIIDKASRQFNAQ